MATYKAKRRYPGQDVFDFYIEKLLEQVNGSGEIEVYDYTSTAEKNSLDTRQLQLQAEIDDIEEKKNAIAVLEQEELNQP